MNATKLCYFALFTFTTTFVLFFHIKSEEEVERIQLDTIRNFESEFSEPTDPTDLVEDLEPTNEEPAYYINKTVSNSTTNHKLVAIITGARSGSTWLGSLFQLSEDVLYVFEPLDPRYVNIIGHHRKKPRPLEEEAMLTILARLCTCKFVGGVNAFGKSAKRGHDQLSTITKYSLSAEAEKGKRHMEEFCEGFSISMPKCVRLYDIGIFKKLQDMQCNNWQVIHLIRDPRAVIRSRILTFHELYSGNGIKQKPAVTTVKVTSLKKQTDMTDEAISVAAAELCETGVRNKAVSHQPWITHRYFLVKYEQLVGDPRGTLEKLYSFIGEPLTPEILKFALKSTSGDSYKDGGFQVVKDSQAVSEKWRTLDLRIIRIIEDSCTEFFETFGYEVYTPDIEDILDSGKT